MAAEQRKKMIPSMILDILREQTDENHTLDQKDILDELNKEFNPPLDRKTVRRNIEYLIDMGVPIVYTESPERAGTISGQTSIFPENLQNRSSASSLTACSFPITFPTNAACSS